MKSAVKALKGTVAKAKPAKAGSRVYARKDDIVLAAAERAFFKWGYSAISMDRVAELAGVSKRTVYSNFRNKQTLFAAVLRKRCDEILAQNNKYVICEDDSLEVGLVNLATSLLSSIYTKPQIDLYKTVVAEARHLPEIGQIMFDGPIMYTQCIFEAYLRKQVAAGLLELDEIELAASQLIAMLKTNLHMRLIFSQPGKVTPAEITHIARESVGLFLHGALPR
ncbi:TetR/AcrR family transcriptional regulator [Phenylobacterium sp.]|uniref:TetR/AcrR family transcriptional regulator n=1 Tax=Phenylobacterium sp. TaxID=1871053 RepID=UPI0025EC70F8|nr:TetR/AcrR family transcriptional regulator [Phenylobacterium sp.]